MCAFLDPSEVPVAKLISDQIYFRAVCQLSDSTEATADDITELWSQVELVEFSDTLAEVRYA